MKYKFTPDNESNLIESPVSHEIIGEVDIDNLDLLKIITEGPTGKISFKADTEEEQIKLDSFMEKFIRTIERTAGKDGE